VAFAAALGFGIQGAVKDTNAAQQTAEEKFQLSAADQAFIDNANQQAVREFAAKGSVGQVVNPSIPTPNQTLAQQAEEIEKTIPGGMGAICSQDMNKITRAEEMLCDAWKGR
jgi:hypothetical protein